MLVNIIFNTYSFIFIFFARGKKIFFISTFLFQKQSSVQQNYINISKQVPFHVFSQWFMTTKTFDFKKVLYSVLHDCFWERKMMKITRRDERREEDSYQLFPIFSPKQKHRLDCDSKRFLFLTLSPLDRTTSTSTVLLN